MLCAELRYVGIRTIDNIDAEDGVPAPACIATLFLQHEILCTFLATFAPAKLASCRQFSVFPSPVMNEN